MIDSKDEIEESQNPAGRPRRDKVPDNVVVTTTKPHNNPRLPREAHLPINRCNLPAVILGSLTYQKHPVPLQLDGIEPLQRGLFERLEAIPDTGERAHLFLAHMRALFSLEDPEAAGYSERSVRARTRASYLRIVRGWAFNPDGIEAAVLKGWVESRFGLLPRHHGGPIRDLSEPTYRAYLEQRSRGLYGTNALDAQLDLLYTYAQHELARQHPDTSHLTLYRGVNRVADHECLATLDKRRRVVLLNSVSSFTSNRDRAGEFGDYILETQVPIAKVCFFQRLLPELLKSEDEFVVIGGVYEVGFGMG